MNNSIKLVYLQFFDTSDFRYWIRANKKTNNEEYKIYLRIINTKLKW